MMIKVHIVKVINQIKNQINQKILKNLKNQKNQIVYKK